MTVLPGSWLIFVPFRINWSRVKDCLRIGTEIDRRRKRARPPARVRSRRCVLSAASERFRTRGYAGTSLDDLVDATGLARPSLYAAFGDKRALYLAALDRTIERVGGSFRRADRGRSAACAKA